MSKFFLSVEEEQKKISRGFVAAAMGPKEGKKNHLDWRKRLFTQKNRSTFSLEHSACWAFPDPAFPLYKIFLEKKNISPV